jgi:1-acyl-sn-glycerol-3-phosphate acyltransferase
LIEAKQNRFFLAFFSWYSRLLMKWHFRTVRIEGELEERDASFLVVSNHFSWWDGFFVLYLNQKRFGKNLYVMMLEEQLRKRMFLNKCGAFSVANRPKELMKSVDHAASLLEDKSNLVLMFPQGRIETSYRYPFAFERGVEEVLQRTRARVRVVFVAIMIDYFSSPRPGLFLYFQQPDLGERPSTDRIEAAYNAFFADCVARQKET